MPRLPQRIAVVSSPTAAGYGDFCHQLQNNPGGFYFYTELFPALMQGDRVEESVLSALDKINSRSDSFDVVVIIRGGGATSDLSGFDTYLLAAAVRSFLCLLSRVSDTNAMIRFSIPWPIPVSRLPQLLPNF